MYYYLMKYSGKNSYIEIKLFKSVKPYKKHIINLCNNIIIQLRNFML